MEAAYLLALLAVLIVTVTPILALVALARVRNLERRIAALETRPTAAPPVAPPVAAPPVVAPPIVAPPVATPLPATAPPVAPPVPQAAHAAAVASAHFATATQTGTAPAPSPPIPRPAPFDWETMIAGHWLNRIGLLAVAIGMSFFLKYAIDNDWVGPRGQVALGLLIAAALVAWSSMLVKRGLTYFADGLAGLGAAAFYLSLWAGTSYYRFISTGLGFAAMIGVTAGMLVIALGRNSKVIAVLAMLGGFLTPWLVSTGRDAQVELFVYLALNNAALIALARARNWRFLELPAFVFTQIYFWGWYDRFYTDAALVRTSAFAALFFAVFSALPIVRARRDAALKVEQRVLVLVNAAVFLLVLRVLLWPEYKWTLTLATLALSAVHLWLARMVPDRPEGRGTRILFAGLALTFATLVIPIRLNGHWITLGWAVEAAVLAWSGFRTKQRFPRAAAYVIFVGIALRLAAFPLPAATFLFNARLATALIVGLSAAVAVWFASRRRDDWFASEPAFLGVLSVFATVVVLWGLTMEVDLYFEIVPDASGAYGVTSDILLARSLTISLLWTLAATALVMTGVRMKAAMLRWQGLALFGITTVKVFVVDLDYLSGFYRVTSSIALGVVLLIVSFLYQRSLAARRAPSQEEAR